MLGILSGTIAVLLAPPTAGIDGLRLSSVFFLLCGFFLGISWEFKPTKRKKVGETHDQCK